MTQQRGTRDVVWIGLLAGLFALLCINVAVGIREGFARPPGGVLLVLLSSPGLAFGWGGVALLFVAIPYALLTWRHGKGPGSLLAVLGSLVFAFGVGGLAGVLTTPAAAGGGRLAGGLASLLRDGVGTGFAGAILALVAVPGLLLALAPLVLDTTGARAPSKAAGGKGAKAWYPERRVAPDGTELPPEFGNATDVGPIRYREPGERPPIPTATASTVTLSPPSAGGPAATKAKPIAGIRYADEPLPDVGAPPTAAPREVHADDLPSGVRYARSEEPAPPPAASAAAEVATSAPGIDDLNAADDVGPPVEAADPAPDREARSPSTSAPPAPQPPTPTPSVGVAPTPVAAAPAAATPPVPPVPTSAPARPEGPKAPEATAAPPPPPPPKASTTEVPATAVAAVPKPTAPSGGTGPAATAEPGKVAGTPTKPPEVARPSEPVKAPEPKSAAATAAVPSLPRADAFEPAAPLPAPAPLAELRREPPAPPTPKLALPTAPVPVTAADAAVNEAMRSSAAYRRKLDATGIVDGGSAASATAPARPPAPPGPAAGPSTPAGSGPPRPGAPPQPRPPPPARPQGH
ncbi:MAG: hypothetical protein JNM10_08720, partial [Planctomycetia bacterium]|nr:hypothetical protein [Planctomycetia bacterium]